MTPHFILRKRPSQRVSTNTGIRMPIPLHGPLTMAE